MRTFTPLLAVVLVHCSQTFGSAPPAVKPPPIEKPWGVGCKQCWREVSRGPI